MTPPPLPPPPPPGRGLASNPSSPPNSTRASMLLGSNLNALLSARKDLPITPSTKMKQLQWDKLPHQQVSKTLWNDEEPEKEHEMLKKLQIDGVWMEMEEDFKAKQLVINLMARQKRAELKSVLDVETKKRVEILIQGVKKLEPEEIARKIQHFDQDLCSQVFLSELKRVLPSPEQVGKLNVYRNSGPEELAELHPSDRLMVKLIQIDRLGPRIEGMLYKCAFEERWSLLDQGARKLSEAGDALLHAKAFKELLSLILLIGNYMNGTGVKGGAFGFRVSSINKLVDTKSVNNTTLLHFLERTVCKHFPDMEQFLEELAKPAEAYRVNLQEVRKGLGDLRDGLKRIREELEEHFARIDQTERYGQQMWNFINKAKIQVDDLVDEVRLADTTFTEVIGYYGEEDNRNMNSSEFYGIFKTFVTSYKKCKAENQTAADERLATAKRKQAAETMRLNREKAMEMSNQGTDALDSLLEKLRNGDTVGTRKNRRARPSAAETRPNAPLSLDLNGNPDDLARDLLARLASSGFEPPATPSSPTFAVSQRRRRRKAPSSISDADLLSSPLLPPMSEMSSLEDTTIGSEDSSER